MITDYDFASDLEHEVNSARGKFPGNKYMLAALVEEVGELAQALMEQKRTNNKKFCHEDVYKEAIQVAAMAFRLATEGEEGMSYDPESGYRGKNWKGYKDGA